MKKNLRAVPSVEKVAAALADCELPRPALIKLVRRELAAIRAANKIPDFETIVQRIRDAGTRLARSKIQPVLNGTGVIIHTNLGRAPLSLSAAEVLTASAQNYCNLEIDLASGERGARAAYLENNLALACGAEAATVANNGAAALILILRHFTAHKKEVIISRGELVQIGGGFRIPDILETSGATLREVGTTNRTALADYAKAIGGETAMILKVHRSNFFMGGFVESPSLDELSALAKKKRIPLVEDLGSGALIATEQIAALEHEPTPAETLRRGIDLVCFSGDKLLGGPQAGIIVGKARLVAALKRDPFFRALRCDKLILAALQTTVDAYLRGETPDIPVLQMLRMPISELRTRAEKIVAALPAALAPSISESKGRVGGGTLPQSSLTSITLDFNRLELAARLRRYSPAIIGYVAARKFKIDLRTIFPEQDEILIDALRRALAEP